MSEELQSVIVYDTDINDAKPIPPLPAGTYPASVMDAVRETSKTGNAMIKVALKIRPENYPIDFTEGNPDGTTLTTYIVVQPAAKYHFLIKQSCANFGVPIRKTAGGGSSIDVQDFMGQDVFVKTLVEKFNGRDQAKIVSVSQNARD